jgi:hypothetical protein
VIRYALLWSAADQHAGGVRTHPSVALLEPFRAPPQIARRFRKLPLFSIFFRGALLLLRFLFVLAAFLFAVLLIGVFVWHVKIVTAAIAEND